MWMESYFKNNQTTPLFRFYFSSPLKYLEWKLWICKFWLPPPYSPLYLLGELPRLRIAQLAVDGTNICLQLTDLVGQLLQRQGRVQAPVVEILIRLEAGCHVFNQNLDLRETLAGQIQLQKEPHKEKPCFLTTVSIKSEAELDSAKNCSHNCGAMLFDFTSHLLL